MSAPSVGGGSNKRPSFAHHDTARAHVHITLSTDPVPTPQLSFSSGGFLSSSSSGSGGITQPPSLPSVRMSPSSSSTSRSLSPSSTRHGRAPSIAVQGGTAGGGGGKEAVKRWKNLIHSELARLQREGFRRAFFGRRGGGRGLTGPSAGGGGEEDVKEVLRKAWKQFGTLWVTEGDALPAPASPSHLHGDSDLPSSSSSSRRKATKRHLTRLGVVVLFLLTFLVLRSLIFPSSSSPSSSTKRRLTAREVTRLAWKSPHAVLRALSPPPSKFATSLPGMSKLWVTSPPTSSSPSSLSSSFSSFEDAGVGELGGGGPEGDVTAVVLHWKRTDNVRVILAHLCRYEFLDKVVVWNNNPEVTLTRETFSSSCPTPKLLIYNSPRNLLFLSRYLGCLTLSSPSTPYCYFQDDDWVVQPLRAMYSLFKRDPEGPVVVSTNEEVGTLYGLEWCFFNNPLHTCFTWLGTGSFVSRSHVERFLATTTFLSYSSEELAHADNSFTTFLNEPPYVLEGGRLAQLPDEGGHSEGEGRRRNKEYIHRGLLRFTSFLTSSSSSSPPSPFSTTYLPSLPPPLSNPPSTSQYRDTLSPPLPPHPYAHHARSPCLSVPFPSSHSPSSSSSSDLLDPVCIFSTNVPLLPPPSLLPYPGPLAVGSLQRWEEHLGHVARGWREGMRERGEGEWWSVEEGWKGKYGWAKAVDGDPRTAFRSADVIRENDYLSLSLLSALSPAWVPQVSLHVLLDDAKKVLGACTVEVSGDGVRWSPPRLSPSGHFPPFSCSPSSSPPIYSSKPSPPFPDSRLLSPLAARLRRAAALASEGRAEGGGGVWGWVKKLLGGRGERVQHCTVTLSSRLPAPPSQLKTPSQGGFYRAPLKDDSGEAEGGEGWKHVRIVVKGDGSGRERVLEVGWGVYELWMTVPEGK
ncbi:hypothetical protein JCM8547_001693 [Rhodosporidiobolus lusitaniae]